MGRAGIVLGLEVSRLARNSTDWHRLLEICALTDTLILDEDGVYDPAHFNDRLLLGPQGNDERGGAARAAARLRGGILNKARRGELRLPAAGRLRATTRPRRVSSIPTSRSRRACACSSQTFQRTGSATATVKAFRDQGLFPRRAPTGRARARSLG